MIKNTLKKVEELYSQNLKNLGPNAKSVGWKSKKAQDLRFDKLFYLCNLFPTKKMVSINELGCGYGAFFNFIENKNFPVISKYIGYDISLEMVNVAMKKIKNKKAKFLVSDKITEIADYSFASGIFNVSFEEKKDVWEKYIKTTLHNMNEKSRYGFAFNALTTYVDFKADDLYYADPFYWFDYCKNNFSKNVSLIHDYPLWEWTIIVKKNEK
jgi:SAM-dependent methyltransferase